MNPRSSFQLRRYQSSKTLPLPRSSFQLNTAMPPFNDKQMIDKLTNSLSKITVRPRQPSITVSSYPAATTTNYYQTATYQQDPEEYGSMHVHDKVAQIQKNQPQHQQPHHYYTLPRSNPNKRQSIHGTTFNTGYSQEEPYSPAWTGTLKSSGSSYHHVQAPQQKPRQQFKPTQSKTIEFGNIGPLKIVNSQYNTPLGLYSNRNIGEELTKQVG